MKIKVLIGLLLVTGLVLAGCDNNNKCPDGGDCKVYFTGQGLNRPAIIHWGSTHCSDENCSATKMATNGSATDGYSSDSSCFRCGN